MDRHLRDSLIDLGGTFRARSPAETLNTIEAIIGEKFGITRVANVTGLDNINIPTYLAIRPTSKFFSTSQGKGITHELAKISAIMESIEGWYAENLGAADVVGSYDALNNQYPLADLRHLSTHFYNIPFDLLKTIEMPWMKGKELHTGLDLYFPRDLINLDFVACNDLDTLNLCLFPPSSNGLASGNTFEEALCHAMYEVIERHCWHEASLLPGRFVDPTTITSPHLTALMAHLDEKSIEFQFVDMTNDIQVPVFMATLTDRTGLHAIGSFCGAGAHLSSEVALSRAITEAVQSRLTFISGSREDAYPAVYRDIQRSPKQSTVIPAESLVPFIKTPVPPYFNQCIEHTLQQLKQAGFDQVIVYDHTRTDIAISVVHVLIPKMQFNVLHHNHYAYAPDEFYGLGAPHA